MERFARHSRTNFPLEDDGTIQNFGMCRRSGLSDLKRRFPSSERMRQMSPFCGALSLSLSRRCNPLYLLFKCLDTSWRTNKREFFPIFGSWFELSLPPSRSRAKFQPIRDPVNTSRELSSSRKLRSAISLYTSPLEHYPKDVTTDITSGRITILYTWKGKKSIAYTSSKRNTWNFIRKEEKKKRGLGRVGIQGFGYKGYRREGRKETKGIEFYSMHKMNGGRRGGVRSDFIREIRHHSTTHRGGQGSYVAGESSLTCCCCCCRLCGRCGLTNRSMAVADAEPPPPMIPVANGGPNGFESILATSRDFRFSSFKKAHVDMCQPFSFASNHRPSTTTFASTLRQQHVSTDSRSFSSPFSYLPSLLTLL